MSVQSSEGEKSKEISGAQCRAARGFLNWSFEDLAEQTGIARNTINNFETGKHSLQAAKLAAVLRCFQSAGIVFSEKVGEESVTLKKDTAATGS